MISKVFNATPESGYLATYARMEQVTGLNSKASHSA